MESSSSRLPGKTIECNESQDLELSISQNSFPGRTDLSNPFRNDWYPDGKFSPLHMVLVGVFFSLGAERPAHPVLFAGGAGMKLGH